MPQMGFILMVLGFAMIVAGLLGKMIGLPISGASGILLDIAGLGVTVIGFGVTLMSFYRRTSADVAFVRTGYGGSKVVLDGGIRVIPFLHNYLEINLRTM